ncbi:MAG: hypothetical protein GC160_15400 [Acidobacteria bacterium]|nr:hypothetical protein [Acidobacteriota bacterium]
MSQKRKIEVFSAGCPTCEETISLVKGIACSSCEIEVLDMRQPGVAKRAKAYGIGRVPAVVVDGQLADCCRSPQISEQALRASGIGAPL